MSIIAAKIDRERHIVDISSDSICLMGSEKYTVDKIFQLDEDFIIGGTGEHTSNNLLISNLYEIYTPIKARMEGNIEIFLYNIFKEAYEQTIEQRKIGDKVSYFHFDFLVFFKNKLYKVFTSYRDDDNERKTLEVFTVNRDYLAIGCDYQYATCAMRLGKSPKQAIKIANEFENNIDNNINTLTVNFYE